MIGPQTVIHFADLFAPVPYAGAYAGAALLSRDVLTGTAPAANNPSSVDPVASTTPAVAPSQPPLHKPPIH